MTEISATIQSGLGRGKQFIAMTVYENLFTLLLGMVPFHGTLNLKIEEKYRQKINDHFEKGKVYEQLTQEGKEMGGIRIIHIRLKTVDGLNAIIGIGVRPLKTSHSSDILEIVAHEHIRDKWNLTDGDQVFLILI